MKSIFEKIIDGDIPCDKVFENERILAFKDIAPQAPVHILVVPKKHIPMLSSANQEDAPLLAEMILVAKELAQQHNIQHGFRIIINNGEEAGQTVFHLHLHLLGGKPISRLV